jgi:carbonic anhydrase/acetyltransferase-like protein (isoleucine patch superfamily)
MAVYRYGERVPRIGKASFVSDSARVIGDVTIGCNCYIGHGAVLRGDYGAIRIGDGSAVEENAVLHIRPDGLLALGRRVTVGHGALIHGRRIDDFAVIGIGAVIGFDVVVGTWSIVAEGCVVPQGIDIPADTVVAGVPYKIIGPTEKKHKDFWTYGKQLYVDLAEEYPRKFERIG